MFQQMVVLMLIMLIGFLAAKKRIFSEQANKDFSSLVNYVTAPALILSSTAGAGEVGTKGDSLFVLLMATLSYVFFIALSFLTPKIFRAKKGEDGIIQFLTVFANNGFMGFPVVLAIFGTGGLFYASIYNIPNNLMLYSIGILMVAKGNRDNNISWKFILMNPANIAAFIALFCFFTDTQLPTVFLEMAESIGNITSPLAMMIIGASMAKMELHSAFKDVKLYVFALFRMVLLPVLIWFSLRSILSNEIMLGILVIIAAMPGPTMAVTLSVQYDGNTEFATRYVFLSTLLSVLTIPLISLLLA